MMNNGIGLFQHAQQARQVLIEYGFTPLCKTGNAEHFVRDGRRVILVWAGNIPGDAELQAAEYVWFRQTGEDDDPCSHRTIIPSF